MTADYTYTIDENNVFTVYFHGEEVYTSRPFRLRVQAERKAKNWIMKIAGMDAEKADFLLDVQKMSIDPDTIFGGSQKYKEN